MKIRIGFVSNSSSSSFIFMRLKNFDSKVLLDYLKKHYLKDAKVWVKEYEYDGSAEDLLDAVADIYLQGDTSVELGDCVATTGEVSSESDSLASSFAYSKLGDLVFPNSVFRSYE